ncbi:hypothetical protein A3A93_05150 [Candidatus Roizmanbacteria bacterium RIFCSPLOWO2_01_FULL_38_12]|uniref:Uncharacterized protein n=1 Tax=Candidatus Roizmanbacteria bacterium RIFCSPLOWO2_01_FULL_38_12 TaxID=1802061 RepID=A0A1F7IQZ8_9BACT|nr:MAG: hypothetical protein A2861_03255 [Candidatus Roizmanbacteria bacterium RIFCSPHIGHO2_01_FULL_38_15]OGK35987.1 MAG: hypothetical protein A3F59_05385 [Candidatus Roizmanbacteria bacterium RIFCSPHIGHO2_12_FULL_38_13]OGK45776.1 MAG: hypothetical protein A3A93_05150 [Candidatus Roizmanbacteria bacterium RIFCSPLOWO2_01_FULL_38_12]
MYNNVPQYIKDTLKGEPVDFIVQSSHDYAKRRFGSILLVVSALFSPALIFPLAFSFPLIHIIVSGSTQIKVNGILQTFNRSNPWGAIVFALIPAVFSLFFIIPMLLTFKKGLLFIRKKGHWYAGTNQYLIEFNDNSVNYYKWSEFENTYNIKNRKDAMDIILTLKKSKINNETGLDLSSKDKLNNMNITINGKPLNVQEIKKAHSFFMHKIGLLGIQNGGLVLNMIKHNMERYKTDKQV